MPTEGATQPRALRDATADTTVSRPSDGHERPSADVPVLGFAALSGTGNTTLLCELLPLLGARGLRIGIIKHAHHDFDVDYPGKDSYRLRKAGAQQMLIASANRQVHIVESPAPQEPRLTALLADLDTAALDLVLVEGFKREPFAKIELHRHALGNPLQQLRDPNIIAIAADAPLAKPVSVPVLDLNDPAAVADFVLAHIERWAAGRAAVPGRLAGNA